MKWHYSLLDKSSEKLSEDTHTQLAVDLQTLKDQLSIMPIEEIGCLGLRNRYIEDTKRELLLELSEHN